MALCGVHRWEWSSEGWRCISCGLAADKTEKDRTPCCFCGRPAGPGSFGVCADCLAAFSWEELYRRC